MPRGLRRAAYSWLTDQVVRTVLDVATKHLHPLPNPTAGERLALLAVGGYGRGEMAPYSDVDLLFLTPYKITAWAESVIESMLYMLWDLQLKVGHASRTVNDCLRLAQKISPSAPPCWNTAIWPATRIWRRNLANGSGRSFSRAPSREFIEAKLAERDDAAQQSRAASATWSSPT